MSSKIEFEEYFEKFAAYSRIQGASEEEIQEMKVGLLDSMLLLLPEIPGEPKGNDS